MKTNKDQAKPTVLPLTLLELAREICNQAGVDSVEGFLDKGEIRKAQAFLLGVLDYKILEGREEGVSEEVKRGWYQKLGCSPEEASCIRQSYHVK